MPTTLSYALADEREMGNRNVNGLRIRSRFDLDNRARTRSVHRRLDRAARVYDDVRPPHPLGGRRGRRLEPARRVARGEGRQRRESHIPFHLILLDCKRAKTSPPRSRAGQADRPASSSIRCRCPVVTMSRPITLLTIRATNTSPRGSAPSQPCHPHPPNARRGPPPT